MSTMSKIHTHNCIARLKQCEKYRNVCRCSTMWLNICAICTKKFFSTLNCKVLNIVNIHTATIISFAWQTFCILVCQVSASSCKHCWAYNVFTCNKLKITSLSYKLFHHTFVQFWVIFLNN